MNNGISTLFVVLVAFIFASEAVIPRSYGTINQDDIASFSISSEKLQNYIIGKQHLQDYVVTNQKLASFSVSDRNLQDNSVTARAISIDFVHITIPLNPIAGGSGPYTTDGSYVTIVPLNNNINNFNHLGYDNYYDYFEDTRFPYFSEFPQQDNRYVAQAYAKGTGVIIGWYPARNGNLMRYQADRAIKYENYYQAFVEDGTVGYEFDEFDFPFFADFALEDDAVEVDLVNELGNNNEDFNSDFGNSNGVPIYSPSIERISIDEYGLVSVYFFGAGFDIDGPPATIDITVTVLLDNQIGQ